MPGGRLPSNNHMPDDQRQPYVWLGPILPEDTTTTAEVTRRPRHVHFYDDDDNTYSRSSSSSLFSSLPTATSYLDSSSLADGNHDHGTLPVDDDDATATTAGRVEEDDDLLAREQQQLQPYRGQRQDDHHHHTGVDEDGEKQAMTTYVIPQDQRPGSPPSQDHRLDLVSERPRVFDYLEEDPLGAGLLPLATIDPRLNNDDDEDDNDDNDDEDDEEVAWSTTSQSSSTIVEFPADDQPYCGHGSTVHPLHIPKKELGRHSPPPSPEIVRVRTTTSPSPRRQEESHGHRERGGQGQSRAGGGGTSRSHGGKKHQKKKKKVKDNWARKLARYSVT